MVEKVQIDEHFHCRLTCFRIGQQQIIEAVLVNIVVLGILNGSILVLFKIQLRLASIKTEGNLTIKSIVSSMVAEAW